MPSPKKKRAPTIVDPHAYVLGEMARGCPLKTLERFKRLRAWLGSDEIPAKIVTDLKARGLIEFTPIVHNDRQQFGNTRWYRLRPAPGEG